jgi:hypothetical protein
MKKKTEAEIDNAMQDIEEIEKKFEEDYLKYKRN